MVINLTLIHSRHLNVCVSVCVSNYGVASIAIAITGSDAVVVTAWATVSGHQNSFRVSCAFVPALCSSRGKAVAHRAPDPMTSQWSPLLHRPASKR